MSIPLPRNRVDIYCDGCGLSASPNNPSAAAGYGTVIVMRPESGQEKVIERSGALLAVSMEKLKPYSADWNGWIVFLPNWELPEI